MARLPQPPLSNENSALHRSLTDVITFLRQTFDNGSKHPGFTQAQIDTFTDLSFSGTILFNETTGESNIAYVDNNQIAWRPVGRTS